jgi:hypothetical protein
MPPETREQSVPLEALRLPRWLRALLAALGALGLYALIGYQLVPWLVRDQAVGYVREHYGRALRIGAVRFDPFLLALEIDRLTLPDRQGALLDFAQLTVDFEALDSLWRRAWVFREITLERPTLRAEVRPDGVLNVLDLLQPSEEAEGEPPAVAVDALQLHDGSLTFRDLSHAQPFTQQLTPISFRLSNFRLGNFRTSKEGGLFSLDARGEQGARFWWKGELAVSPVLSSRGRIALQDVQLASLAAYAGSPVVLTEGRGSFSLSYQLGPGASATLHDALLSDLTLTSRADDRVHIPELRIKNARLDYPRRTVEVEAVRVDALSTRAVLDEQGRLNLARMVPASEPAAAPSPWQLSLARFDLRATAALEDRGVEPPLQLQLSELEVHARDLSLDLTKPVPVRLHAALGGDGAVRMEGTVTPASTDAELELTLEALRLARAQPYLRPYAALQVESGTLSLQGKLTRRAGAHGFDGGVTLRDLHTRDVQGGRELVGVAELSLLALHYQQQPAKLTIDKVTLRKPAARVVLSSAQTLNISEVLRVAQAAPPKPTTAQGEPMAVEIGELAVDDMRLDFSDYFIKPNFALDLRGVRGSVKGLSTDPRSRARMSLRGTLGASAPVQIEGQLSPFAYDANTDVELRWQNVPLPVFNPYSGRFAGYKIDRGDLATTLHYRVRQGKLDAQHHVRVDQLTWGDATDTKESASMPVRLATALLRDRHGVITLDVPVQGSLDDPSFAVWPLVKQVIANVALKAVMAPFDFLGSLFEGAEKARFVDFEPGQSALAPSQRGQLDALAQALAERPSLMLDVPLGVDRVLDRQALAEQKLRRGLAATIPREMWGAKKRAAYHTLDDEDRADVLQSLYQQLTGQKPALPEAPEAPPGAGFRERRRLREAFEVGTLERMTRSAITVDAGELEELGLGRAHAIERALTASGKIDAHRVLVSSEGSVRGEQGKVRFELALK